ncbi:MAG: 4-hydroxythreonine-4-phosphate dehydrogenase PdxA, partial [Bacteroidales bacterium]
NRELKALISLPVSAEKIRKIEPEFKNQTHFIAQHFEGNPFKILLCEDTRLSFLSTSTLKNVEEVLTPECIEHRINVFYKALQTDFACTTPRIAVVSMNKDLNSEVLTSADNGVKQTISSLLKSGKPIFGPFPLTKLLHADKERRAFDGILCMYKEQVDFLLEKGMSDSKCFYTAGLPIIHAEPVFSGMDKGAAFNSLLQALYSVIDIERNRLMYAHLTMDPLTFESIDSYEKQDKE